MQSLIIDGGNRLTGEIEVCGAKNSALPILAATALTDGETVLYNCPVITDVYSAERILTHLGCSSVLNGNTAVIKSSVQRSDIPEKLMSEMRSSIIFLGALLGKTGKCALSFPGGCELGARPIDIHINSLKKMGASVKEEFGTLVFTAPKGLNGAKLLLPFPSVGATENIMLAACLAKGETLIKNAAREPEIADLADYLNKCGANIKGAGEGTITISGVSSLKGCEHTIMPDRIVAATYMSAAASTGGELRITKLCRNDLDSVIPIFEEMGCYIYAYGDSVFIKANKLKAVKKILTMPYPAFPTDAQAVVMASLAKAEGTSVFVENIFENRYQHVPALTKMGADIKVEGKVAIVEGVKNLFGANILATDLRGGAALVVAALGAEGRTVIGNIHHIDRGYENIEKTFSLVGGKIIRK
ncbi:MAG: UDP-N-acetylglucosamine 1-carboxyvinyltransferase [Oscillospiraceae bacterium]